MWAENYIPKARPVYDDHSFWSKLKDRALTANDSEWLELDWYDHVKLAVDKLVAEGDDTKLKSLHHESMSRKPSYLLRFSFR